MRNWEKWVRSYLDLPAMTDRRDHRIVAELAAHLEELWREARAKDPQNDTLRSTLARLRQSL